MPPEEGLERSLQHTRTNARPHTHTLKGTLQAGSVGILPRWAATATAARKHANQLILATPEDWGIS